MMLNTNEVKELKRFATEIRLETMKEFKKRGFGHVGGALSIVETLAVLYGKVMNIDPKNPRWEERDWLVLSKGHAGPSLYATLALKGYFPLDVLMTLNNGGSSLPSHCDRNLTPGIDMTTGSLGQGASSAIGIALGNRIDKKSCFTYLIVGDGECDEGQVWEAVLFAAHHKLDNLIMFIDNNKKQLDGYLKEINDLGNIGEKLKTFNWHVQDVNGADVLEIYDAIEIAKKSKGQPSVIVLDTIKGQGIPFVEDLYLNHHIVVSEKAADEAIIELQNQLEQYN